VKKGWLVFLFLLFEASILFYGNGTIGLFESSEARYAEVSREMLETGDFISPQMDYVYHFTKPPLAYWLTSLGMAIFGVNPFGVRFFVTLFALLALLLAYKIAGEDNDGDGFAALLILGSSPLFFIMAKVLTTDIFLTFFITLGVYFYTLREKGKIGKPAFDILFGICGALGILTKGQVPFLYWLLIFAGMAILQRDLKPLKALFSPLLLIIMVLFSGWWFIIVGIKHPGLLQYLFFKESVEASYSAERFHPGPLYYYLPILLAGLFPFWLLTPPLKQFFSNPKFSRHMGFTLLPFLLWSLFPAKLPTYLLPSVPGWALLFSNSVKEAKKRLLCIPLLVFAAQIAAMAFIAAKGRDYIKSDFRDVFVILAFSAIIALSAFFFALKGKKEAVIASVFLSILLAGLSFPQIIGKDQEQFKIAKELAFSIKDKMEKDDQVLELRTTAFSIPFYLEKKVFAFENNFFRKKFLGEKPAHILQGDEQLKKFMNENLLVWVVVDKKSELFLKEKYPSFSLYKKGSRYILYISPKLSERIGRR
jgi:4-amino-4-deoxy-L-arabinose transferase-like glycosyltransferase